MSKNKPELDPTSSLNDYCICNECGGKFRNKGSIYVHFQRNTCAKSRKKNVCKWCNVEFRNRGNLATHAFHMHGDSSYKKIQTAINKTKQIECKVCNKTFPFGTMLRYHIRRLHFNLKAKVPYCEKKKVNQVWFENVQNTNVVVEIKKTGKNSLIMRRLAENTAIRVNNNNSDEIDLTSVYPVRKIQKNIECTYCGKFYVERDYKKHVAEHHMKMKKHQCNNCHRTFQRTYAYMRHVCSQLAKVKGVKNNRMADLKIANIVTLAENAIF